MLSGAFILLLRDTANNKESAVESQYPDERYTSLSGCRISVERNALHSVVVHYIRFAINHLSLTLLAGLWSEGPLEYRFCVIYISENGLIRWTPTGFWPKEMTVRFPYFQKELHAIFSKGYVPCILFAYLQADVNNRKHNALLVSAAAISHHRDIRFEASYFNGNLNVFS